MRLTNEIKKEIERLRLQQLGYKKIAQQLDLPLATVKSYCHRHELKAADISDKAPTKFVQCLNCGATLENEKHRAGKKFCSDKCRNQFWFKEKKKKTEPKHNETLMFCINCGEKKSFTVKTSWQEISVRDITFSYQEQSAYCIDCGEEIYVPIINDNNVRSRERAFRKHIK